MRELDNVLQRALILRHGNAIEERDLIFEDVTLTHADRNAGESGFDNDDAETLGTDLKDHERRLILGALEEGRGSRKFAADKLGISPRTLRYKIARMRDAGIAIPGH